MEHSLLLSLAENPSKLGRFSQQKSRFALTLTAESIES
jgi:hypothetical protein